MEVNGNNYYFRNYEEVKTFLEDRGFEYEIPYISEKDLEYRRRYCIEIKNNKIIWCAVEHISGGLMYNYTPFYDNVKTYRFKKIQNLETVYVEKDEFQYKCPYCGTEIIDYSKNEMENGNDYCGICFKEYHIEVEEK